MLSILKKSYTTTSFYYLLSLLLLILSACPLCPLPPTVVLNSSRRLSLVAVCAGLLSETCMALAFQKLPQNLLDLPTFW